MRAGLLMCMTVRARCDNATALQEDLIPELAAAVSAAARFVDADAEDCVPTCNTTTGVTMLLRSLTLPAGSSILALSTNYSAIATAVGRAAADAGAGIVELHFEANMLSEAGALEERLRRALKAARGTVKAVVLDHVLSFPPVVLPVQALAAACHEVRFRSQSLQPLPAAITA